MPPWDGAPCMEIDRFLDERGIRHSTPTLGQTLGDPLCHGHANGSMHYLGPPRCTGPRGSRGQARDHGITYAPPGSDCDAIARALLPFALGPNHVIAELLWSPLHIWCDNGFRYVPPQDTINAHFSHCHSAMRIGDYHLPIGATMPTPDEIARATRSALAPGQEGYDFGDLVNDTVRLTADTVWARFAPNSDHHPNYGDLVNDVTATVTSNIRKLLVEAGQLPK